MASNRINKRILDLVKLKKDSNIAGIQFTDLCATPISRKERGLKDTFIIYKIIEKKFRESLDGRVEGHGIIKCT